MVNIKKKNPVLFISHTYSYHLGSVVQTLIKNNQGLRVNQEQGQRPKEQGGGGGGRDSHTKVAGVIAVPFRG